MEKHSYNLFLSATAISSFLLLSGCSATYAISSKEPAMQPPSKNDALNAISPTSSSQKKENVSLFDYFNQQNSPQEKSDAVSDDATDQSIPPVENVSKDDAAREITVTAETADAVEEQNSTAEEGDYTLQNMMQGFFDSVEDSGSEDSEHMKKLKTLPAIGN